MSDTMSTTAMSNPAVSEVPLRVSYAICTPVSAAHSPACRNGYHLPVSTVPAPPRMLYGPTHRLGTARRSNRCGDATAEDG